MCVAVVGHNQIMANATHLCQTRQCSTLIRVTNRSTSRDQGETEDTPGHAGITPEEWLGRAVRRARLGLGLSQTQLAEMMRRHGLRWNQVMVAKTEAAQRPIRVNEAVALAKVLGLDASHLIAGAAAEWDKVGDLQELQARVNEAREGLIEAEMEAERAQAKREFYRERLEEAQAAYDAAAKWYAMVDENAAEEE